MAGCVWMWVVTLCVFIKILHFSTAKTNQTGEYCQYFVIDVYVVRFIVSLLIGKYSKIKISEKFLSQFLLYPRKRDLLFLKKTWSKLFSNNCEISYIRKRITLTFMTKVSLSNRLQVDYYLKRR